MTATLTPRTPRSTRAARVEAARRYRAQGLLIREIAERMGISRAYANSLLLDPDGTAERARKDRNGGVCDVCGAPTDGSYGRKRAPTRCNAHHGGREKMQGKIGTGPMQQRFLTAILYGTTRYGDLRAATDLSGSHTAVVLHRLVAHGLIERVAWGQYRLTDAGRKVIA